MYKHELNIVIFSSNELLAQKIRAITPQESFSHTILVLERFENEALPSADILITDADLPVSYPELRSRLKDNCIVIAVMSPEAEAALTDEECDAINDVWLSPLQAPRIRLRMHNILRIIKRDADARVHLLWLDTLIDSMPDLVWFKDMAGVHHKVNDRFCDFVNKDKTLVIGSTHAKIWDTEDGDDCCQESEAKAIKTGQTIVADEIVRRGEKEHLFKTYKTPLKGPRGEIIGTVGFGHDCTNLLNLDIELKFFIESMPFPLAICDENDELRQINGSFMDYFGVTAADFLPISFQKWQMKTFQMEVSPVNGEKYLRFSRDGERMLYVSMIHKDIKDIFGKKVGSVNIYRDITAEKDLENRIWREANTDSLTGLANRHSFDSFVRKLSPESVIHLCYIDLDEFKAVNDRWGHNAGDEALRIVAKSIRNVFAQDFPARLGGDEFLVCVQRDVPISELERLARRLLQRINEKLSSNPYLCKITGSIGIRAGGALTEGIDVLIRQADRAMYAAKEQGKGRYCMWHEEMDSVSE